MPILPYLSYLFGFSCLFWLSRPGWPAALPDVVLACMIPFAVMTWWKSKAVPKITWGNVLVTMALCWMTVSCAQGNGLVKACQLCWYLLAGPLVIALLAEEHGRMLKGLAVGLVVNALTGLMVSGGLMGWRTGYGVGLAAATALLLMKDGLPLGWTTPPWGNIAQLVYGASVNTVSGIVLGVFALWTGHKNGFVIRERQVHAAPFIVAALVLLLVLPLRRAELLDCVTAYEKTFLAEQSPRRWVQERVCAWRAMVDAPWFGHGAGSYQATVGEARFRGTFPRPNETKVELNTQDGWQVLSVEFGMVPAIMLLLGLLVLWKGRRHACLVLLIGMFFTPLLVKGAGMLTALVLGLAFEATTEKRRQPLLLMVAWGVSLLAMCGVRASGVMMPKEAAPVELSQNAFVQTAEAEALLNVGAPFELRSDEACSGGKSLEIVDHVLEGHDDLRKTRIGYAFTVPEGKTLHLWLRVRWKDGCGNSIYLSLDGMPPQLAGNDGTYQAWHWVYAGDFNVAAGSHELAFLPSEDGIEFDQLVLCDDSQFHPTGIFGQDAMPQQPKAAEAALELPVVQPSEKPLLFGISGPYRGGFEVPLTGYGLPWTRLMDVELEDIERLRSCTAILLSEPMNDYGKLTAALTQFVKEGGTLVLEKSDNWMGSQQDSELYPKRFWRHVPPGGALITDDSWLFEGIAPGTELPIAHDIAMQATRGDDKVWKAYGKRKMGNREMPGAVFERTLGQGRIYYCAVALCFQTMWRDRVFEPVLANLLRKITVDAGHQPLWKTWKTQSLAPNEPCFADDFMREAADVPGAGWIVKSGAFRLTGDHADVQGAEFALSCREPGDITVGDATWRNFCFAVAMRGNGTLKLTATTTTGRLLVLSCNDTANTFSLNGEAVAMRAEQQEAGTWHRVAMLCRDGVCEAFVDGRKAVELPLFKDETLSGAVTLSVDTAGVLLDDVSVRAVDDCLPGTDRAVGQEGSCLSMERMQDHGVEPFIIFTPYINLKPVRETTNAVDIQLPIHDAAAKLMAGGKAYKLDGSQCIGLPAQEAADSELYVSTPRWKDYVFKSRMTDWYYVGSPWESMQRWSCDRNWSWLGVETNKVSVLWHRQQFKAPLALRMLISMGASDYFSSEYERGRDLNLVIGGNGRDVSTGWLVRVMRINERGVELWHDGKLVASRTDFGMARGHTLHHTWFEVAIQAEPHRLRVFFEGRLAIDQEVEETEFSGQVGIWTEENSVRLGRAQIAF